MEGYLDGLGGSKIARSMVKFARSLGVKILSLALKVLAVTMYTFSWKVLVYQNLGLHFGDIHLLEATFVPELSSFVGNVKYAIFFSQKGPGPELMKSLEVVLMVTSIDIKKSTGHIAMLLEYFKLSEPWIPNSSMHKLEGKRPNLLLAEELEGELFKLFLETRFQPRVILLCSVFGNILHIRNHIGLVVRSEISCQNVTFGRDFDAQDRE
ncbi:hypothetical protein FNV43_RR00178 [Rhamnella rubrinervis]|uniref:RNA-dependent RNA polymerase n=1 Tax=Rhamnella rubrinervis TaxID=2594499 RepID=A0A8K0HMK6_9ROSA|nr:hypothetical protein FNV43_RR00178 [Rhamnella rubrinervis]